MIYDISRPIHDGSPVFPGDAPFQFTLGWDMVQGASVNVGQVSMSVHTGTHTDAPRHFDPNGRTIGDLPLSAFIGPCVVVDVSALVAGGTREILPDVFAGIDFAASPRLLLKTLTWHDAAQFPEAVPTLSLASVAFLAAQSVVLFGVDVPSVDALDSTALPVHHALNAADIRIVESLDLAAVPPGVYHLTALPLALTDADASPVRAILQT